METPKDPTQNIPDNGDEALTNELLADADSVSAIDAEQFLKDLLADSATQMPTPEQVEAQAARVEAAKSYDVGQGVLQLHTDIATVKASINKLLTDTTAHLNAEFNKCIVTDDETGRDFLVSTEGPRWYQLAVADFQTAFMKLERAINHPEGL